MSKPLTKIFLMVSVLLGSAGVSFAADFQKGLAAAQRGDFKTAYKLWLPIAERGNSEVQLMLGVMHHKGDGVPQDSKEAIKWWKLAAEQGHEEAQYNLANNA